jgi:hypothetical protein
VSQPGSPITVTVIFSNVDGLLEAEPEAVIFNDDNWNVPQEVTINAKNESVNNAGTFGLLVQTAAYYSNYYGLVIDEKYDVTIYDEPKVNIDPTELDITEGGLAGVYEVWLNGKPKHDVEISFSIDEDQIYPPITSKTFTPSNWNDKQKVYVTAKNDEESKGNRTTIIEHTATSDDDDYNAISIDDVNVLIRDNEFEVYLPMAIKPIDNTLFEDRFDGSKEAWYVVPQDSYEAKIENNEYIIQHWKPNSNVRSIAPFNADQFTDYYSIDMDAHYSDSSSLDSRLGFVFEFESSEKFYIFIIYPNTQQWWIYKYQDQWVKLAEGSSGDIQKDRALNHLQLIRKRSTGLIQVLVNGTELWSGNDASITNGKSGVILLTQSTLQGTAEAAFDNFIIKRVE